ncbi:MAG TPA: hypothetical protein GXZ95_00225 [Mollicutes bacterium]|nr:hypothetical protein [Mollicutes bacterium]
MTKKFIKRYHYILYMGLSYIVLDYYIQNINQGKNDMLIANSSPSFFGSLSNSVGETKN